MPNALVAQTTRSRARGEAVLDAGALGLVQARVVRLGLHPGRAQRVGGALGALARRGVDEGPPAPDELRQERPLLELAGDAAHVEEDVGPVEPGDEDLRLCEAEQRHDVVADLRRRRGRERR